MATPNVVANAVGPSVDSGGVTIWRFAIAGAVGGFGSFILSHLFSVGLLIDKPIYLDLPGELFLGACAGLFGVYLLTESVLSSVRTIVFALACGLFWSSIITATKSYLDQHSDNQAAAVAKEASKQISQTGLNNTPKSESGLKDASVQLSGSLEKLSSVSTTASREAIVDSSKNAVDSLPTETANTAQVEALKNIGLASVRGNAPQVSLLTFEKLNQIATTSNSPMVKADAKDAAITLANASPIIPNTSELPSSTQAAKTPK